MSQLSIYKVHLSYVVVTLALTFLSTIHGGEILGRKPGDTVVASTDVDYYYGPDNITKLFNRTLSRGGATVKIKSIGAKLLCYTLNGKEPICSDRVLGQYCEPDIAPPGIMSNPSSSLIMSNPNSIRENKNIYSGSWKDSTMGSDRCWLPKKNKKSNTDNWVKINVQEQIMLIGIIIAGRKDKNDYIETFKLEVDNNYIQDENGNEIFKSELTHSMAPKTVYLATPVAVQNTVALYPISFHGNYPGLRWDLIKIEGTKTAIPDANYWGRIHLPADTSTNTYQVKVRGCDGVWGSTATQTHNIKIFYPFKATITFVIPSGKFPKNAKPAKKEYRL